MFKWCPPGKLFHSLVADALRVRVHVKDLRLDIDRHPAALPNFFVRVQDLKHQGRRWTVFGRKSWHGRPLAQYLPRSIRRVLVEPITPVPPC